MLIARKGYSEWHQAVFGESQQLLPITDQKLQSFCLALFRAGYAPTTIMQIHLSGLCIWVRDTISLLKSCFKCDILCSNYCHMFKDPTQMKYSLKFTWQLFFSWIVVSMDNSRLIWCTSVTLNISCINMLIKHNLIYFKLEITCLKILLYNRHFT